MTPSIAYHAQHPPNTNNTQDPESALKHFDAQLTVNATHLTALYGRAKALDALAALRKNNVLLRDAIKAYELLLKLSSSQLPEAEMRSIAEQCIKQMRFIGEYLNIISFAIRFTHYICIQV